MAKRTSAVSKRATTKDHRLSAAKGREFLKLFPPTKQNWSKYFPAYVDITISVFKEARSYGDDRIRFDLLSGPRRDVLLLDLLDAEVRGGGFEQLYGNSSGDGAHLMPAAIEAVGRKDIAAIVKAANACFPKGPAASSSRRSAESDRLPPAALKTWDKLSSRFFRLDLPFKLTHLGGQIIAAYPGEFFKL